MRASVALGAAFLTLAFVAAYAAVEVSDNINMSGYIAFKTLYRANVRSEKREGCCHSKQANEYSHNVIFLERIAEAAGRSYP